MAGSVAFLDVEEGWEMTAHIASVARKVIVQLMHYPWGPRRWNDALYIQGGSLLFGNLSVNNSQFWLVLWPLGDSKFSQVAQDEPSDT